MVISDLNYLEIASNEVLGAGYYKPYYSVSIKQTNFNATYQKADAEAYSKYSKFNVAAAVNVNSTNQANVIEL